MGISNFHIEFDSPTNAYYSGTNVSGKILFTLDKPKKVRAVAVKVEGKAKVQWTNQESVQQNSTEREFVTYSGDEEIFTYKYNVAGGKSDTIEIPPGQHSYPFTASLPPNLPTSFDGENGHIRYTVTATLDRPWKFDQHASSVFAVVTPIDLNYNTQAKEPVKLEEEKSFCCCCCKSGPLQLIVALPFTGFVPGQPVPLTVEVDNASNVQVNNVIVKLNKVIVWKAREPKFSDKEDTIELHKLTFEGVEQHGSKSWSQFLTVPADVPALNLDQCSIIRCSYNLAVTADVSGLHTNLAATIPVFLGTVPIYTAAPTQPSPPLPIDSGNVPNTIEGPSGPQNSLYPTITTPLLDVNNPLSVE